jgi:hypothetical protein
VKWWKAPGMETISIATVQVSTFSFPSITTWWNWCYLVLFALQAKPPVGFNLLHRLVFGIPVSIFHR